MKLVKLMEAREEYYYQSLEEEQDPNNKFELGCPKSIGPGEI